MVDWEAILSVDALGLDRTLVDEVHAREFRDWTDDPALDVTVVLQPTVDVDGLTGADLARLSRTIYDRIYDEATALVPYVDFMSREDWDKDVNGVDEEEDMVREAD
ncbi:MAG: hypothetical protein HYU66_26835 [Armatimonadetes bacterium]|nr:hypothetical protein [Armatimonadota bacterium]